MTGIAHSTYGTDVSDLLECVAAFGRSLGETGDLIHFLSEFSACAQRLAPHDYILIPRRDEDGHTCSIFAEYAVRGARLGHGVHYTLAFERGEQIPARMFGLVPVFEGQAQIVADMTTDPRFSEDPALRAKIVEGGLRARLAVPLYAGGRVTGALVVMSGTAGLYTNAHVSSCRRLADLIGPLVETVVVLHRERRCHERLRAVAALPPILGDSLKVGDGVERLAEAVRPLIDFDVMVLRGIMTSRQNSDLVAVTGSHPVHLGTVPLADYSFAERLARGNAVLIRDTARELDLRRPGDRRIVESGDRSLLGVPLVLGERVGGVLIFGTSRAHWYNESDVEVAGAIANALVLAVQHQRLAEHQQRLGAVETKAQMLERRVASLRTALDDQFGFDAIIGRSPKLIEAIDDARKVAATPTTVLLTGESGTGKEVLARAIHQASARAEGPFLAVNCAALPETLVESELFGHERGAFTGADRFKRGRFERAAGGTLFLDEIGNLTPSVQAKLLRVLQDRQYERVGGTSTLKADVRLVAATNCELERAVAEGRFRDDLYYRLAVFRIHLPPLRERGEDVLLLADYFVRTLGVQMGRQEPGLSGEARGLLLAHSWPGNVRELQNAIERALILAQGELILAEHLGIVSHAPRAVTIPAVAAPPAEPSPSMLTIAEQEKHMIAEALQRAKDNKTRAAAALGLSRTQLLRRIRRFRIHV